MAYDDTLEGIDPLEPVNKKKGKQDWDYSEAKSNIEDIPASNRSEPNFISKGVDAAQSYINAQKERNDQTSADDRIRRKAEAAEKVSKYRDELETKKAEAQVKLLEAQTRAYGGGGGNRLEQLRNSMVNMRNEGRSMFSGSVSQALGNSQGGLSTRQTTPPLMMQIMNPRGTSARGGGMMGGQSQSVLARQLGLGGMQAAPRRKRHKTGQKGQVVIYVGGQQPTRKTRHITHRANTVSHSLTNAALGGVGGMGGLARSIYGNRKRR